MRAILAFLGAVGLLTTAALAAHPTVFDLHVRNATGGAIRINSTFTVYPSSCAPKTSIYGDEMQNDTARSFHCDTQYLNQSTWLQLVTIMSADRNHILCNVQILPAHDKLSASGGVGPRCQAVDHETFIDVLVR